MMPVRTLPFYKLAFVLLLCVALSHAAALAETEKRIPAPANMDDDDFYRVRALI